MTVILKPLVTEKSMLLVKSGMFTFLVDKNATKRQVEKAVAEKFEVNVLNVSTVNIKGKTKLQRSRKGYFQTAPFKKAVVQLKKGQKIALFESAEAEEVEVRTAEGEVIAKTKEKKSLLGKTKVKIESSAKPPQASLDKVGSPESSEKTKKKKTTKKGGK